MVISIKLVITVFNGLASSAAASNKAAPRVAASKAAASKALNEGLRQGLTD